MSKASWIGQLKGSVGDARNLAAIDKAQREAAAGILNPNEVVGSYDAGRVLLTTIGGQLRPITADDLALFRQNIRSVQKKLQGGIRARQVLDLSLPIDRERAQKEIKVSVPSFANSGLVRFITNAGPDSDVTRHHVMVNFLSFNAAVSAGARQPKQTANWLRKQPLQFDCDCGRHRYWYRYISTIGGFNAGRAETGFPKEKNPRLVGVACKHVLRTMAEIESSGSVLMFLSRLIERARQSENNKAVIRQSQKEAEKAAKQPRARDIKTSADRAKVNEVARQRRAIQKSLSKTKAPAKKTQSTRRSKPTATGFTSAQIALFKQMGLTDSQIEMAAAAGKK